jgi:hypothetical protein
MARATLGVYKPGSSYKNQPDEVIPYAEGRLCVNRGDARFVNRGTAIQLKRKREPVRARSFECDRVIVEGWRRGEAELEVLQVGDGA